MNKDDLSDERLALLHQQKRVNAFFVIYKRYHNYGYAVIYRTLEKYKLVNALKDERDAILYDAIMEGLKAFDNTRGTFRKLMSSILEHETINYVREFRKDPLSDYISLDSTLVEGTNLRFADSLTFADKSASPQELVNFNERNIKVEKNYSGIHKRKIKSMMHLKEIGYTYHEIAIKFDISEKAVRSIFYRIKRKINTKDNNKIKK